MAININSNFHIGSALFLDDRMYLTKAEMLAVNESIYPDYFLAVCSEDGFLYMFDKNMADEDKSATTGKFKLFAGDVEEAVAILNGDDTKAGSVKYSIKNLASSALYSSAKVTVYTFKADGHEDVKVSADVKASIDAGTAYDVDDVWKIEKTATVYEFVDKTGTEAPVEATCTESQEVPTLTIKGAIDNLAENAEVSLKAYTTKEQGLTDGYLKTYEIFQGDESVGKIDIPKDLVVSSGSVIAIKAVEGEAGKYQVGDKTYTADDVANKESEFYGYPLEKGTFIKLVIANQALPLFINASSLVDTGSLGKVTEDVTANVEVGGIAIGDKVTEGTDITTLVKQMLTKYYAPTISLDGSVSNKVQRAGNVLNNVTLTATVGKKSKDITSVVINGVNVTEEVKDGGNFTESIDEISSTTEFVATATDGKTEVTAKVKYEFVLPYMYGVSSKNVIETDTDLASLTEVVEKSGAKTFSYTAENQYCVFVMPASYADLKSILDPSSFENISSWTKSTYTSASGEAYKVYITNTKITASGFKYTFK